MCGIVGLFEKKQGLIHNKTVLIEHMANTIVHRGPDDHCYDVGQNYALGMRRLAILDLQTGLYPFSSEDGKIKVIFNGEIYNYKSLQSHLKSFGYTFKTNCDGEVILRGYQKWGTNVFSKLRGMFAIAIIDLSTQTLVIARDRLGIKPVYYMDSKDAFFFSSEAKSLISLNKNTLVSQTVQLSLDMENVKLLSGFMFLPKSTQTIINQIKKLEPGHFAVITEQKTETLNYWELRKDSSFTNLSYEDALETLDSKLSEVIQLHLMSDVPLAHLLSGGIDSSLIVSIAAKKFGAGYKTFTAKFDHAFNESDAAAKLAKNLGTDHHEIFVDIMQVALEFNTYIAAFDDLTTFDGGLLTTQILSKEINSQGVKVLTLGEGADEVFGGYSWFGLSLYPTRILPRYIKNSLYYYAISRNLHHTPKFFWDFWDSCAGENSFSEISRNELVTQLPNHLLMKVDKGTMAHSIEARVPYLDHELVEFVYSLPDSYKTNGSFYSKGAVWEKHLLRDLAKRYLPDEVVYKKKKGFMFPMNDLLNRKDAEIQQLLTDENSLARKFLSKDFVYSLFDVSSIDVVRMHREYFKWRLYILEVWNNFYKIS